MGCGNSRGPVVSNTQARKPPAPVNQPYSKLANNSLKDEETSRAPAVSNTQSRQAISPIAQPYSNGIENVPNNLQSPKKAPRKTGEFDSIYSYEEAASFRAKTPEAMWAIVKKTCHNSSSREWTLNSVKNRRGWKTIRLFVSSTFRDFHEEREVLVKEVFPDLRLWCEERKLHLVECDLRWGIPIDSSTEETVRICLEEIDRCYRDNVMPYFLNLTCGRAGWVPDFGDLTYNLASLYGWVYGLSITEMEIVHGAFRRCNPNALFMIRDTKFTENLPEEVKEAFYDDAPLLQHKLVKLREALKEQFSAEHVVHYEVDCEPKCLHTVKETQDERDLRLKGVSGRESVFYQTVYDFFKSRIEYQYPLDPTPEDPLEAQKSAHESFLDTRSQVVLGRDKILNEIDAYITSDKSRAPLLLIGHAGSGKSAIMARIASSAVHKANTKQLPSVGGEKCKVFFHFVGATPGSTDLAFFLQRLTREIGASKKDVISDLDSLVQLTNSLLSNPNTKPAVIIVDAINQLDDDKIQYLTRWLPDTLSPNVRVVLSMIDNTECHRMLRAYKTGPREILCGELDYASRKAIVENILKLYNKRLDDHQMSLFLNKEGSANPLWLTLACEELRVFGHFNMMDEKIGSLKDDLISLEEQLLSRFELENGGPVVIATVCLLETSRHGLLETELLQMLADDSNLIPPEYVEGDDGITITEKKAGDVSGMTLASKLQKEVDETYVQKDGDDKTEEQDKSDKEDNKPKRKVKKFLTAAKWALVYRALKPLLRPCGDLGEGRLDFYHRSISKAVRRRYFSGTDGYVKHQYAFWHGRHAEFFESCDDYDRKSEELPYHLEQLLDHNRLTRCLLDWEVFGRLYSEDFSVDLLRSWQKAGGYASAALLYKESLDVLKSQNAPLQEYADKMETVTNFLIQAGQYTESYALLKQRMEIEEKQLGSRTDQMANIYHLMTKTKSEIVKNHNFVTMSQLEEDKEIVEMGYKSLSYRKQLQGEEHQHKKALMGILLAHHLSIVADLDKSQSDSAREKSFELINEAIAIFEKQQDMGHVAEAIMTKSFVNPRHTKYFKEKEEMLKKSFELCLKTYGEKHMLMLRLYLNIGILYEDNRDYYKAYDYFVKWNETCMEVLGPAHPKTKRSKDTLEEAMYVRIREQRERQAAGTA